MFAHKLVLGTVQFGLKYGINNQIGLPNFKNVCDILDCAYQNNLTEIDTAQGYGESENVLGQYNAESKNSFKIQSKFSVHKDFDFEQSLKSTLQKLNISKIDGLYFHRFSDFLEFKNFEAITKCKKTGLLNKLGVSIYTSEELEQAILSSEVDMIQLPFNVFDRDNVKIQLLKIAGQSKKMIYVRSVFLQGLMLMNPDQLPTNLKSFEKPIRQLNDLALKINCNVVELCLNYVVQQDYIDRVVIGVDSLDHLRGNLKAINLNWTKDTLGIIEQELNKIEIEEPLLLQPVNWK